MSDVGQGDAHADSTSHGLLSSQQVQSPLDHVADDPVDLSPFDLGLSNYQPVLLGPFSFLDASSDCAAGAEQQVPVAVVLVTAVRRGRRRRMQRRSCLGWQEGRVLVQVQPPWGRALQQEQVVVPRRENRWRPKTHASCRLHTR
jgi:hypothetical protein